MVGITFLMFRNLIIGKTINYVVNIGNPYNYLPFERYIMDMVTWLLVDALASI